MSPETTSTRAVTVRCPFCATRNRVNLARLGDGPRCGGCKRPLLLDRPIRVAEADFDATLNEATVPVVVDFYADWCGPCRAMAPMLDDLAGRHAGHLLVLKLDTDQAPALSQRFGIRGIPTLIAFDRGREVRRHVGMADFPALEALAGLT